MPLPSTPSRIATSAVVDDTPLRSNSAPFGLYPKRSSTKLSSAASAPTPSDAPRSSAFSGPSNTTRAEMDPVLRHELSHAVFSDLPGFIDRFFPPTDQIAQLFEHALSTGLYDTDHWTKWPPVAAERSVLSFFQDVVDNSLLHHLACDDRRVYRFVPSNEAPLRNGDCMRKTDLLLTTQAPLDRVEFASLRHMRYDWSTVRVVGELKCNPIESNKDGTLMQLANYAREVFGAQPGRRWLHAFTLCGSNIRAWLFDRSGAIGSELVNMNAQPLVFLRIICGYAMMDAAETGFDPDIKWDVGGECVYDPTVAFLELEPSALFARHAIVSRGSVCWKARPYLETPPTSQDSWLYVVKDQWRAAERQSESEIISAMRAYEGADIGANIGLPRYTSFGDHLQNGNPVDIVSVVRRDLVSAKSTKQEPADVDSVTMPPPQKPSATVSMPPPPKPSAWSASHNSTSSRKRKRANPTATSSSSKKIKPSVEGSGMQPSQNAAAGQAGDDRPQCNNRIFSRLVMSPVGKSLDRFSSYTELLSAIRDAIRGHSNLYHNHDILHRDVSVYNILIAPPEHGCGAGILIDLDLAISRNRLQNSGASHRTGTPDFMAVGLLSGQPHRACHDLESFFFVLLWLATFYDASGRRREEMDDDVDTVFHACNSILGGSFVRMAMTKSGYVQRDHFDIMCLSFLDDQAREQLGPLLAEWRDLLYPATDEDGLWEAMIDACDRRIVALQGE
ncbi:hypothetical protein FN846DRAFT_773185 [Sphaerosporella brunnea]|uniref:non-specific serine/threonine protein kinase n=1 Tax=Sphaerosporella brunnea TaxID=1250544 RepID=A0A5J5F7T6_9PEZI|nr:hypothetical protein FN846DRAFT_773185 [Sphaerosporella brunnea]